jgi:hypothetical protein
MKEITIEVDEKKYKSDKPDISDDELRFLANQIG